METTTTTTERLPQILDDAIRQRLLRSTTTSESGFSSGSSQVSIRSDVSRTALLSAAAATGTTGTSWWNTALILTNVILGVGLLNFPRAYSDGGGLAATLPTQMVVLLFIFVGMVILGDCIRKSGRETLQDLVYYYMGSIGLAICDFMIVLHNFGTCITLLVIVADQIDAAMAELFGPMFCHSWYKSRTFTLPMITAILILPVCFKKTIADFKWTSYVAVLTIAYIVFLVVWKYYHVEHDVSAEQSIVVQGLNWVDVFKLIPTLSFSYEAHIELVPLYHVQHKRTLATHTVTVAVAMLLSSVVYIGVGVYGWLTFGSSVSADLLTSYDSSEPLVIVAMVMLALKAIMTYPIIAFCTRLVVDDVVVSLTSDCCSEPVRRYTQTLVLVGTSLAIAVFVPSIGSVISLLGFSGSIFVFVIPGLCYLIEYRDWRRKNQTMANGAKCLLGVVFVAVGALVTGVSTVQSVQRYIAGEFSEKEIKCS